MNLKEIVEVAHSNAQRKGFWDDLPDEAGSTEVRLYLAAKIALIHSEASEALEELRKPEVPLGIGYTDGGKMQGVPAELADIIIRVADLAGFLGIDLEDVVRTKMVANALRPPMHGKAF